MWIAWQKLDTLKRIQAEFFIFGQYNIKMPKKSKTKSRYCKYHLNCDRPENCFKGDFCSFFEYNPDISSVTEDNSGEDGFKDIMDKIWDGDEDIVERKI